MRRLSSLKIVSDIMLQNEIKHIVQHFFKHLKKLMNLIKKDFDRAAIQDFRRDVKKLRSFVRLLALESPNTNHIKIPRKLKELYTLCGKIRDTQLLLLRIRQTMNNDKLFDEYKTVLKSEMKQWKKELNISLKHEPLHEAEQKILSKIPYQLKRGSMQQFFKQKKENIHAIIAIGFFKDDELHIIRKNIKDIIYVNKLLNEKAGIPAKAMQWNKAEIKRLELLALELGEYNDSCVATSFLNSPKLKGIKIEDRKRLQLIRRKLNQQRIAKRKELIALFVGYRF